MDLAAAMALAATLWLSLPHGDAAWDLLETVAAFAFTEPMNTGGTVTGVPLNVGSEASSWTQATYRLGLADVTDPAVGGRPLLYPDLSAVGRIHVRGSSHDVQTGAPGTVLTLVPADYRGMGWRNSVAVAASPSGLQANGSSATDAIARLHSLGRVQATAGGHAPDQVWLFAAGAGTWSSHHERGEAFTLPGNVLSFTAHPLFVLPNERRADVTAWIQQTKTPFAARALLRDRNAAATQWYGGVAGAWQDTRRIVEVSGAWASTHITPEAAAGATRGTVERLTDDPIETLVNSTGGSQSRSSIAATIAAGSRVRLKGGVSASYAAMKTSPFGAGLIGETLDGMPARVWDYGLAGDSRRSQTTFAAYGSAGTYVVKSLYLDAGIRVEHVGASARGAAAGIGWTSFEPRGLLHYRYDDRWGLSITARRYHPVLPLAILSAGDPAAAFGRSFLWNDRNGDRLAQDDERGTLVSLAGPGSPTPGFSTIDPALTRPFVDELQVAIDVRITKFTSLRFSGISRRGGNLLARYNVGVPFEAYTVHRIFDPGLNLGGDEDDQMLPIYSRPSSTFGLDRYELKNIPSVNSTYGGLYLAMLFGQSTRWHMLVAATALHSYAPAAFRGYLPSQNDEMLIGDSYSDPNSNTYSEGRTLFDRGYGLKVSTAYNAPRRITIAAAARYADGQNFTRFVLAPDLPQGPDAIRAFANGKTKFTYTATLDLRLQKVFTMNNLPLTVGLESYNTTNLRNEVEEYTVTGPNWRMPTFTQPPRVIRLTAGISF